MAASWTFAGIISVPDIPLAPLKDARHPSPDLQPDPAPEIVATTSQPGKAFVTNPPLPANVNPSSTGRATAVPLWGHASSGKGAVRPPVHRVQPPGGSREYELPRTVLRGWPGAGSGIPRLGRGPGACPACRRRGLHAGSDNAAPPPRWSPRSRRPAPTATSWSLSTTWSRPTTAGSRHGTPGHGRDHVLPAFLPPRKPVSDAYPLPGPPNLPRVNW